MMMSNVLCEGLASMHYHNQRKAQTMTHISRQQHKYFGATVRITTLTNEHGTELVVSVLNPLAGNYIERGRFVANSDMSYTAANALASQLSTTKGTQ
tara:strand:+ start:210 stop:500 length:291 start_codon:yes stop_codon:yes gene_type:complete